MSSHDPAIGLRRSGGIWRRHVRSLACSSVELVLLWIGRSRQRRHLSRLDDRMLRDIGLSRTEARGEWAKRFWQT